MPPENSRRNPPSKPRSAAHSSGLTGNDRHEAAASHNAAREHDPEQRVGILVAAYIALGFIGAIGMLAWVVTAAGR